MTFLNNNNHTTTVLPDFQYLTSPSGDQPLSTPIPNHIPKSIDVNQYGNNITNNNNTTHVNFKKIDKLNKTRLFLF